MTHRMRKIRPLLFAVLVGATFALDAGAGAVPPPANSQIDFTADIEGMYTRVKAMAAAALQKKDITRLNCLNDKKQRIEALSKLYRESYVNAAKARAMSDTAAESHEKDRMGILYQKIVALMTEADGCVGDEASYIGNTTVGLEIDPNIPNDDPTEPPLPLPDVTRPPAASPFE
jgi:hypothetical protein